MRVTLSPCGNSAIGKSTGCWCIRPRLKACGQALITAMVNAVLALTLMLLVEFAITGTFQLAGPYLWAGLLIGLVIFFAQFWRQRHLCRNGQSAQESPDTL